ncbi:uncharacterized protein LOC119929962 isoform X1 [Tachyglossus aculeatus]|uniref:uncharacterized protein LOC119929962 isoform X1 n=1 Tax=Tachyglossus aculeatus TaxID=9261 RepID=UPI0018F735E2|nr:uncharacterized protein LOC119929962 isoform X1 [Tachyglossus aculeatus]
MAAKLMLEILTGNSSGISWNPPGAENSSSASENTEVANVKGITDASEDTEVANVKEVMGRMAHTGYEAFQEPAISPDPRTLLSKQSEDSESGEEVGSSDVPEDSSIRSPSDSSASMGYFPCYRTYEEFLEKPSPSLTRTSSAQSNRRDGSGCSSSLEPLEQRSQSSGHTMESHPRSWESMDTLTQSNLNTPKRYQSHLGLLLATRGEGGLGEKPEPQIFEILSPPAFQQNMGGMLEPIPRKSPQLKPLSSPRGTQEKRRRRKKLELQDSSQEDLSYQVQGEWKSKSAELLSNKEPSPDDPPKASSTSSFSRLVRWIRHTFSRTRKVNPQRERGERKGERKSPGEDRSRHSRLWRLWCLRRNQAPAL